jgi:hypothetical protein
VMGGSCDTLQVPSMAQSRTMVRAASASESSQHGALATKFKRGRFLQRQQCQEGDAAQEEGGAGAKSEPPPSPPPPPAASGLVKQRSSPVLPPHSSPARASPPPGPAPKEVANTPPACTDPQEPPEMPGTPQDRQQSLDPLCGLESVPLLYSRCCLPQSACPPGLE